jgi:hypothetical protein
MANANFGFPSSLDSALFSDEDLLRSSFSSSVKTLFDMKKDIATFRQLAHRSSDWESHPQSKKAGTLTMKFHVLLNILEIDSDPCIVFAAKVTNRTLFLHTPGHPDFKLHDMVKELKTFALKLPQYTWSLMGTSRFILWLGVLTAEEKSHERQWFLAPMRSELQLTQPQTAIDPRQKGESGIRECRATVVDSL